MNSAMRAQVSAADPSPHGGLDQSLSLFRYPYLFLLTKVAYPAIQPPPWVYGGSEATHPFCPCRVDGHDRQVIQSWNYWLC